MPTNADDFAEVAARFCQLLDHFEEFGAYSFVRACGRMLGQLYTLALDLPDLPPSATDSPPDASSYDRYTTVTREIAQKLGAFDIYRLVFDPFEDTMPVVETLSDDLADIDRDLREGLALYHAGRDEQRREAVWYWRFSFEMHWGRHLTGALRPIQTILAEHLLDD